ncbi:hypothetical protein [Candidatus Poriferisocius sp.]|uniref:hypothetical protein n=1 Tax=Candidatus Poriferisocius sp. TaxID=3101276 RepID=UPI003B023947
MNRSGVRFSSRALKVNCPILITRALIEALRHTTGAERLQRFGADVRDGAEVVDGLECRVVCDQVVGMHSRYLWLLAEHLDVPDGDRLGPLPPRHWGANRRPAIRQAATLTSILSAGGPAAPGGWFQSLAISREALYRRVASPGTSQDDERLVAGLV